MNNDPFGKFTFKFEYPGSEHTPPHIITHEASGEATVYELIELFEQFLKGVGYVIEGKIEVNDYTESCCEGECGCRRRV